MGESDMNNVPTKDNLTKLFSATGIVYVKGPDLLTDARAIIDAAQASAYRAVNVALVYRNWLLGRRIAEEDLGGKDRAEYGKQVVVNLSKQLTMLYGSSFDFTNLYKFMQFYRTFPILDSLCLKSGGLLDWSHYRTLLQVGNEDARRWYMEESGSQSWGVRTLQRNISSQYYERTLLSQNKEAVKNEMVRVTAPLQDKLEFIKNPVVAEFLGLSQRTDFTESDLETCILDNLGENSAKLIGCADAVYVFDAGRRKVAQTFRPSFHSSCRFDILLPVMLRQSFTGFIFATSTDGSGNAVSYIRALDMLGPIQAKHYPKPIVGGSMRHSFSLADIHTFSRSGTRPSSRRRKRSNGRFADLFMCNPQWVNYDKIHKINLDRA